MRIRNTFYLGTALAALLAGSAHGQALKAEVMHQWTSAGEAAAVKVLADQFTAAGGEWVDAATTGGENLMAVEIARVTGGDPPTSMQFPMGAEMIALASQGLLQDIDAVATQGNWKSVLPAVFFDAISYEGKVYAAPVNNHGQSWLWFNKAALAAAGAEEPKSWDDFFAAADKLKAANVIPVAIGGQAWQLRILFSGVLATKGGADLYNQVLGGRDEAAIRSPEFKSVVETFLRLRDYADAGNANRDWNVATNMVITGEAGFNFMGDWAKGEFTAAGQTAGEEYGCAILGEGGATNFVMSGDIFVFPKHGDDSQLPAQNLLATVMMDPVTQGLFNTQKGSVPARGDVNASTVDACTGYGLVALSNPAQQLASVEFLGTGDFVGAFGDLVGQLWATPDMTADQFIDQFVTVATTIE